MSLEDLLSAPAVKLLIRKAGARSADMPRRWPRTSDRGRSDLLHQQRPDRGDADRHQQGSGIEEVARPLGGIAAEDAVTFGDMPNDVPMLRWAGGLGVAMGNAHPDALAAANEVTTTNADDGGVARVLERWWM